MSLRTSVVTLGLVGVAGFLVRCGTSGPLGFQDAGQDSAVEDAAAIDAPTTDDAADAGCGFCGIDGSVDAAPSPKFFILVTETPAGSPSQSSWGGVLRYDVADDLQPAQLAGTVIDASQVADPIGLAFRQTSAEVFVGNRGGDTYLGSVSRFLYDAKTETFTPNGTVAMNDGLGNVMQVAFSRDETELFAARGYTNGGSGNEITRFKFDTNGNMAPNGAITGLGSMIGVAVSKDGNRLYATQQFSSTIREFSLPSGTEVQGFAISGASRPHLMVMDKDDSRLYVSDIQSNDIYVLDVDVNDDLTLDQTVGATNPISVALSPDHKELFSTSHNFTPPDVIERYDLDNQNHWITEGTTATIDSTTALGGTLVFRASSVPSPPN